MMETGLMTVYAVIDDRLHDYWVLGIFSTEALAEAWISEACQVQQTAELAVEEWVMDARASDHLAHIHWGSIDLNTGEMWLHKEIKREMWPRARLAQISGPFIACRGESSSLQVHSSVSREHCSKLLLEQRARWLTDEHLRVAGSMDELVQPATPCAPVTTEED